MKHSILVVSLSAILLAGCDNVERVDRNETAGKNPASKAGGTLNPKSSGKNGTISKINPGPAAPIVKRRAPEGSLFAAQRISKTTDAGVHSVLPGTVVKLVKKTASGLVVKDGETQFNVQPHQVTDEWVEVVAFGDTLPGLEAVQTPVTAQKTQVEVAQLEIPQSKVEEREIQTAANIVAGDAAAKRRQLEVRKMLLVREKADLEERMHRDRATAERRDYAKRVLNRQSRAVTVSPEELSKWRARIVRINTELHEIDMRLAAMQ